MSPATTVRLRTGQLLPELSLPSTPTGLPVNLRRNRRDGTVVVALHALDCQSCFDYLSSLADAYERLLEWEGRVLPVVTAPLAAVANRAAELNLPFPLLADEEGRLREGWGIDGGSILIADQWGELFLVQGGSPGVHEFPSAEEVAEWLRFVAIQCPECQGEAL